MADEILNAATWRARLHAHAERADQLTAGRRGRAGSGRSHVIDDFLYSYYPTKPSSLRRWHPGANVTLLADEDGSAPHADWRWYRTSGGEVSLDLDLFVSERGDVVSSVRRLLAAIASRPPFTGCFGMHEWAMVYKTADKRHGLPLRLGPGGTDAVVESQRVRCSHFDAFRFFTSEARPLNERLLTRQNQLSREQPGCLHVSMDSHRYALKLGPLVPGPLALDCFELAREVRLLDMQASPYDLGVYGEEPVQVETPEGRAVYARRQKAFAERASVLRSRLLEACEVS